MCLLSQSSNGSALRLGQRNQPRRSAHNLWCFLGGICALHARANRRLR
ncbi:Uncharacterised protein [Vibrio cholerae]|nr:Uncharacterised protein [Vibrio cholerae]